MGIKDVPGPLQLAHLLLTLQAMCAQLTGCSLTDALAASLTGVPGARESPPENKK